MISLNNPTDTIITFDDGFESIYKNAYPILEEFDLKAVVFPIINYIGEKNTWDYNFKLNSSKHINANQIVELSRNGWEIGSHGYFHYPYSLMKTNEIINDLKFSKKYLEDLLCKEVVSFAIPFNLYSPILFDLIEESGYEKIFFNSFYRSNYYNKKYNLIHRKQVFKISSIKSINNYIDTVNNEISFKDKSIQFCANATVGLKRLL